MGGGGRKVRRRKLNWKLHWAEVERRRKLNWKLHRAEVERRRGLNWVAEGWTDDWIGRRRLKVLRHEAYSVAHIVDPPARLARGVIE